MPSRVVTWWRLPTMFSAIVLTFLSAGDCSHSYFTNGGLQRLSRIRSHFTTDWQSVSMSWYRAPLWDLRPDITYCRNVAVWNLRSCIYEAPSMTRGRVCNFSVITQWSESLRTRNHTLLSHLRPPTWRARFPYLCPPATGWPSYTLGHWVSDSLKVKVKVKVTLQLTVGQSVIMSRYRAHSGTCDQILLSVRRLFSESCCLVFLGRPLWRDNCSSYIIMGQTAQETLFYCCCFQLLASKHAYMKTVTQQRLLFSYLVVIAKERVYMSSLS
jgi:hypothetical protein